MFVCLPTDHGSCVMLHTINAQHVSSIECEELVLCLTFSTAPEGQSINVIAGGLNNGIIRSVHSLSLTFLLNNTRRATLNWCCADIVKFDI